MNNQIQDGIQISDIGSLANGVAQIKGNQSLGNMGNAIGVAQNNVNDLLQAQAQAEVAAAISNAKATNMGNIAATAASQLSNGLQMSDVAAIAASSGNNDLVKAVQMAQNPQAQIQSMVAPQLNDAAAQIQAAGLGQMGQVRNQMSAAL